MSYILEALKKSQQERELGQVPTLVAAPTSELRRLPRGNPWGLVAVGLAALAVAIALYAALNRVEVQAVTPQAETAAGAPPELIGEEPQPVLGSQVAAVPVAPIGPPLTPGYPPQPLSPEGLNDPNAISSAGEDPGPTANEPTSLTETAIRGDVPPMAWGGRPPRGAPGKDALASPEAGGEGNEGMESDANVMEEPVSNDWMEMDEEIGPAEPVEPPPPVPAPTARPRRTKPSRATLPEPEVAPIPEDLRQDVEAFKEELRRERAGAAPRPAAAKAAPEDPTKLRLPLEVEGRLPAFFMTAHIFDKDASKRFVVINALKYTPGETTREGLLVEDILPDGVVLSFQGHRFYRRR